MNNESINTKKDIIILPCTAGKTKLGAFFGKTFTAAPQNAGEVRPFDQCGIEGCETWYDLVEKMQKQDRPDMLEAYKLYHPRGNASLYEKVRAVFGDRFMIFSAGWGLIKSDYKLPYYDITFNGSNTNSNHRRTKDPYKDINQLPEILKKYPDAKIYSVVLGQYVKKLPDLMEGFADRWIQLDASTMDGSAYTKVYRYVESKILNNQ